MPCGKKRKRHKIATHKRKKRLRKNRHKKRNKYVPLCSRIYPDIFDLIYPAKMIVAVLLHPRPNLLSSSPFG